MGGEIRVRSAAGVGTTFTINLPERVQKRPIASPAAIAAASSSMSVSPVTEVPTILVIDDDPSVQDLMQRFLSREGFGVVSACSGVVGLQLARAELPDAIVLDVLLADNEGANGWAILSALKADPELAGIPVIMVTVVDDKKLGYALGAADYLLKPIDYDRLVALLQKHCSRKPAPHSPDFSTAQ